MPGIESLDATGSAENFSSQSCMASLGTLKIAAHSHVPVSVERKNNPGNLSLVVPYSGQVQYWVGSAAHIARAGHTAFFLSGAARTVKTSLLLEVMVSLDESRLRQTASAMLGLEQAKITCLDLQRDREITLNGESGQLFGVQSSPVDPGIGLPVTVNWTR